MSDDLITLLRQGWRGETATDLMREAAREIERLTAKLDRLKWFGESEPAAMDVWWESCDDAWAVPEHIPATFVRHLLRTILADTDEGGQSDA